ncbi:MAG TPA: APC family permease [Pyrinomonadaceae bacterium]|nr:APC family permease [Pyrinomonadaceae bacterium]
MIERLRRDLGTLESYAEMLGILIGAGIFTVTSQAWRVTGPSVILGYIILMPFVLATSVPYAAFISTPLGREPGGEYTHISRTLGGHRIAFVGTWLKIISYVGALAFLATAFADHVIEFAGGRLQATHRLPLALGSLVFFYLIHAVGVRWFGRLQVAMCVLLGVSLVVLVVPGLFAIRMENYQPFITNGAGGLAASLVLLFFSYAGFESLAQTAGEVEGSTERLPRVFLRGVIITAIIFVLMSVVAFGVLPGSRLQASNAPMAEVASVYLPVGAALFVTFGAIMAITTSINSTMLVPSRLAIILARDRLAPKWMGAIHPRTGTPIPGLTLTLAAAIALLISGQVSLALNIAVFALVILYFLHSLTFLLLERRSPWLYPLIKISMPRSLQKFAAWISVLSMGGIIAIQVVQDVRTLATQTFQQRLSSHSLTSLELVIAWGLIGAILYAYGRSRRWRGAEGEIVMGQFETQRENTDGD